MSTLTIRAQLMMPVRSMIKKPPSEPLMGTNLVGRYVGPTTSFAGFVDEPCENCGEMFDKHPGVGGACAGAEPPA